MAKLYPPIVDPSIQPFYGNSITVPFTINRAVSLNEISKIKLIIKSTITNQPVQEPLIANQFTLNSVTFHGLQTNKYVAGGFYKLQIAFVDNRNEEVGYYSNVIIAKYIGANRPQLKIIDDISTNNMLIGSYYNENDWTEKLYSYTMELYDNNGILLESTGEKLHNSTKDMGPEQQDAWVPQMALDSGFNYSVTYKITTINGYQDSITQQITAKKDDSSYVSRNMELFAECDEENGFVNITIRSTSNAVTRQLIYGNFKIYRCSSKDNFKQRYAVAYFSLQNQDMFAKTFKDYTVESGYKYRYYIQQVNDYGIHSEEVWSQGDLEVNYEHLFLFDGKRQLKIKYNPKVPTFKNTILEAKVDTIGGQYPFIFRNENVNYKELSLSGLISYHMDEQNLFLQDSDIWLDLDENSDAKDNRWTHNLTYRNITAERNFKLKVLDWLNDGNIKLLKSPTEGNYIVRLLNVSLAPTDSLGRMLHTFTATAYEVDDASLYQFSKGITIDKTNRYIGYKTTPLYNFPKSRLLSKKNSIITDNSQYEIIMNPSLEYVVGVHFEDVKPGTWFKVLLERGDETKWYTFMVGATGFYAIPSSLGYHVKQVRLVKKSWEINDYGYDIMNNRGQVTYEFERQAKHNNFNDITGIESGIVISAPLDSSKIISKIEDQLHTIDGNGLYEFEKVASEEAHVEVGYFTENSEEQNLPTDKITELGSLLIRGHDYDLLENNYYRLNKSGDTLHKDENGNVYSGELKTTATQIYPYKNAGFQWQIGSSIPKLKTVDDLSSEADDKRQKYDGSLYIPPLDGQGSEATQLGKVQNVLLFIEQYDSKGVMQVERVVENQEDIFQNPFYPYAGSDSSFTPATQMLNAPIFVGIFKAVPVTSIGDSDSKENNEVGKQEIYRNFVTNQYYDVTNVDGEYYIKEEIQNVYNLSFELVPAFYPSPLEDTRIYSTDANTTMLGDVVQYSDTKDGIHKNSPVVTYESVEENNGFQHLRRIGGVTFDKEAVVIDTTTLDSDESLTDSSDLYYDYVELIYKDGTRCPTIWEAPYIDSGVASTLLWAAGTPLQRIYGLTKVADPSKTDADFAFEATDFDLPVYIREETSIMGVYRYIFKSRQEIEADAKKEDSITKDFKTMWNNGELYINPMIKGYQNYIDATTPSDSEVVIVYRNNPLNIEHIDLADRLSYSISAEDFNQADLQNIAAVYLGAYVRGFMTYKHKLYSYRAVLDDGLVIDLIPWKNFNK